MHRLTITIIITSALLLSGLASACDAMPTTPPKDPAGLVGYSRLSPAPVGSTLTVTTQRPIMEHTAEVTVLEVVRGERAWQMIWAASPWNPPPADGHEYLLARIRFRLLAIADQEAAMDVRSWHFDLFSSQGAQYDDMLIGVTPPQPRFGTSLYQGAVHEGWAVFQVAVDDPGPLLTYGRDSLGRGGIWFILAE